VDGAFGCTGVIDERRVSWMMIGSWAHTHRRAVGRNEPRRPEWRRASERCRVLPRSGPATTPGSPGPDPPARAPVPSTSTQPNIEATPAAFRAAQVASPRQPDIYIPPLTSSKQSRIAPRPAIASVARADNALALSADQVPAVLDRLEKRWRRGS